MVSIIFAISFHARTASEMRTVIFFVLYISLWQAHSILKAIILTTIILTFALPFVKPPPLADNRICLICDTILAILAVIFIGIEIQRVLIQIVRP